MMRISFIRFEMQRAKITTPIIPYQETKDNNVSQTHGH